jgi:hypothetical protein
VVETVRAYALQETVGPLKGAGRWLAFGAVGALLLGIGGLMIALGLLRLLQTEFPETFDGSWSWVPYLVALVGCILLTVVSISRVKKTTLAKEPRR